MKAVRATVPIPTHEHGGLLRFASSSALAQTVRDLEVFIVLDGADPVTTRVAGEVARNDDRVRLFPNDKGERHGEAFRHLALQEARGRIVCYLSDDDLWFPDHVEYLDHLLEDADFAHSLSVVALPEGGIHTPYLGDLADPWYPEWMRQGHNFIPLSAAGHTLKAYRSLGVGWSPAPATVWTDLHMWRKFLDAPDLRLVSGGRPTLLHFPSPARQHMDLSARLAEMESWYTALQAPGARQALRVDACEPLSEQAAGLFKERQESDANLARARSQLVAAERAAAALRKQRASDQARLTETASHVERLKGEIAAIQGSIAYRASRRLAAVPVIGRLGRWVGKALFRQEGR